MQNDFLTMNSQGKDVRHPNGKTYKVHPLTMLDHGDLQAWLDQQQEDRLMGIAKRQMEAGNFSVDIQKYMLRCAMDVAVRNRIVLGTQDAEHALHSLEGLIFLTWLAIHKGDPSFTVEEAAVIVREDMAETFRQQVAEAADVVGTEDPKSEAPENGSPTSGAPLSSDSIVGDSMLSS